IQLSIDTPPGPSKEQLDALKRYQAQVKELSDQMKGADIPLRVKLISDAIQAAGGVTSLTGDQYRKTAEELVKLDEAGAHLPPQLEDIAADWRQITTGAAEAERQGEEWRKGIEAIEKSGAAFEAELEKMGSKIDRSGEGIQKLLKQLPQIKLQPPDMS